MDSPIAGVPNSDTACQPPSRKDHLVKLIASHAIALDVTLGTNAYTSPRDTFMI
jgi:hypothetical protein